MTARDIDPVDRAEQIDLADEWLDDCHATADDLLHDLLGAGYDWTAIEQIGISLRNLALAGLHDQIREAEADDAAAAAASRG